MLLLVMVFNILVALALGFVFGRIYQIRRDESSPVAYVPQPARPAYEAASERNPSLCSNPRLDASRPLRGR